MLNFEIEKAVDYLEIPIIVAYTGFDYVLNPGTLAHKWPKALYERITNSTAKCIHIPFKQKCISAAVSQFSVNNKEDQLTSPLSYYRESAYINWGYKN